VAVVSEEHVSLRDAVVAVGERWSTAQRRLVQLVCDLDSSGDWALDGAPTCAHWVADALQIEVCTAREWLRVGRALAKVDVIDAAFEQGRLSYSKVRTLTRVATAANQEELCALAERVAAGRLGHALAAWQARHETAEETDTRQHRARHFFWRVDVDGMVVGAFRLPPASAAVITTPVDALILQRKPAPRGAGASADARISEREGRWPSVAQQRADALVELVRGGGASIATEVVMHVRADGCTLDDGTPIPGSVVERIAPEAFLRALIHDAEGRPINASGRQRHPTNRQRRVVQARDQACVDCGATEFLQYDHDPDYEDSHRTLVDELHLRCWACHRARHLRQRRARLSLRSLHSRTANDVGDGAAA
jgi:Domain of unknown function (DUF222)